MANQVTEHNFTPEQEQAIGQFVADHWGCNFQTSILHGKPIMWAARGPNIPRTQVEFDGDGTVTFGD